jgi:hypothetical protein
VVASKGHNQTIDLGFITFDFVILFLLEIVENKLVSSFYKVVKIFNFRLYL